MRKRYQKKSIGRGGLRRAKPAADVVQLMLDPEMTIRAMQQSVHSFGTEIGRLVAIQLLSNCPASLGT